MKTPLSISLVQADPHAETATPRNRAVLPRVLRHGRWRGGLLVCGLLLAPAPRAGPLDFELYTDSTAFSARVGPDIRRVTFDDIGTKTIDDTGQAAFTDLPVSGSQLFYRLVTQ